MNYKQSNYNYFFKAKDGTVLAFNSSTGGLAKLTPERAKLVKNILSQPSERSFSGKGKKGLKEKLLLARFLIDKDDDEVRRLLVLNRLDRFSNQTLGLTIAPTLACNFRCSYCYEKSKPGIMSPAVEKALVEMVASRLTVSKGLYVTWFGGEPLLAIKLIGRLTNNFKQLCKKHTCSYAAGIITNGYLWDRKTAKLFKKWNINNVQITLDGPPDIHDARRPLADGRGSFERILHNIEKTSDIIPINIRINTDKNNSSRVLELLEILKARGLDSKVNLYFAKVQDYTEACANIGGSCYSSSEYSGLEVDLSEQAQKKGFLSTKYPRVINGGYCTADNISGMVVAPSGLLFKCWNQISEDENQAVGNLLNQEQKSLYRNNMEKWLAWDPFVNQECRDCKILPLCMGGCPHNALYRNNSKEARCESWKYHLIEMLNLTYLGHKVSLETARKQKLGPKSK